MKLCWVFAASRNGVIGKDNKLPWKLLDDLKLFREVTSKHHILMGRKTFESIGKPLPNRVNLVVSRDANVKFEGCHVFQTIPEAIDFAAAGGETELMVIGGEALFKETANIVDRVYFTRVEAEVEGDVIFHFDPNPDQWEQVGEALNHPKDERNEFPFTHLVFQRKATNCNRT